MCLIVLAAWFSPRFAIFLLWLFSDRMRWSMDSFWMGLAGFVFLPWTTLAYALTYSPLAGVSGFGWFLVILGFVVDLTSWFGGGTQARARQGAGV